VKRQGWKKGQSSEDKVKVLYFSYFALFRNHNESKATGVQIEAKF